MPAFSGLGVIYLDDDPYYNTLFKVMLKHIGYIVTPFENAERALQALRADPARWDTVISDFYLPRTTGLRFLSAVKAEHAHVHCAVVSGAFNPQLVTDAKAHGIPTAMAKPTNLPEFTQLVQTMILASKAQPPAPAS
jgi:DNA-binding NtrC family response regulator